jgi:uncharacterized membrane protein
MKDKKIRRLTMAAVLAALVCIATIVIPIPLPGGGYANAGDIVLLLSAYVLGPGWGAAASGIGSCAADLILGYSAYAPGTLIVKALDAAAAGLVFRALGGRTRSVPALAVSGVAGEAVMVLGYFGYEYLILKSGAAAAVGMIPNLLQGAAGVIGSALLTMALSRVIDGIKKDEA